MSKVILPTGKASLGQPVAVPELGIIGEVAQLSTKVKNLITKVKVQSKDGVQYHEVEGYVVEAILLVREIRLSTAFKLLLTAIKGLIKKK